MEDNKSFEKAFSRLETILEELNSEKVSLDSSLKLFEEADSLINKCSDKLKNAEKKIEILVKNREQELVLGKDEKPVTENFSPNQERAINR